jgi:hypothetical protein
MDVQTERRLLQAAILVASLVPIAAGGAGAIEGPSMLRDVEGAQATDLESHYRYLSGLLFGIGVGFVACVPRIERRGTVFRALGLAVVVGGLARLASIPLHGLPSPSHLFGLGMELGVVPLLLLWQRRIETLAGPNELKGRRASARRPSEHGQRPDGSSPGDLQEG